MRYLIVNSDDFGWSSRVNAAVLRAHREGVLTTASLMVAEPAWEEAVRIAKDTPSLGVGLHVSTTFDRALLGREHIPKLVGHDGKFETNTLKAGLKYAFSRKASTQLRFEMEAQFERFASTGLPWSHVDGHQHFHMHPTVFRHLLDLCDAHGANRLRVPREELRAHLRGGGDGMTPVAIGALILQVLCRGNLRILQRRRKLGGKAIFVCDRVYGDFQTSNMHTDYTLNLLARVTGRVNEIYFHPGSEYAKRLPHGEQTDALRDVELKALLDPRVRAAAEAHGLKFVTYEGAEKALMELPDRTV